MSVFKCKMCGGSLSVQDGTTVAECECCGTKQTVPKITDEAIIKLFNQANNLRLKGDYDNATVVYKRILERNDSLAEAHWGLVLCKYGIAFLESPRKKGWIPTCNLTQSEDILSDIEYKEALKYADSASFELYEQQAWQISTLYKEIHRIINSESSYDVFICYKETDESGGRTEDHNIADDIYKELTSHGYKVFFAVITLDDKLGRDYESYIFAALTSAKVMVVLGTKPEYFYSPWVKNEWSRYLHLMKVDHKMERTLIPCYQDMNVYNLPSEISHLQAIDAKERRFLSTLLKNIQILIGSKSTENTVSKRNSSLTNDTQYSFKSLRNRISTLAVFFQKSAAKVGEIVRLSDLRKILPYYLAIVGISLALFAVLALALPNLLDVLVPVYTLLIVVVTILFAHYYFFTKMK